MKTLFYITFLLLIVSAVYSQKERKYIRNGNQDYLKNEFEESELSYRKAVENQSDSSGAYKASFNLSDALYKQEKFPEAINQLNYLTSQQKNKEDLAKVYHNLGNSYLSSGELEKSIDAYKNALRNNPNDKETKYNLAFAQKMLQQQQQQKQEQNQDGNQEKQEQEKQQEQKEQEDKKDQEQPQPQEQEMTKEEAERMLQAIENDEKDLQKKLKKVKAQKSSIEKDW